MGCNTYPEGTNTNLCYELRQTFKKSKNMLLKKVIIKYRVLAKLSLGFIHQCELSPTMHLPILNYIKPFQLYRFSNDVECMIQ